MTEEQLNLTRTETEYLKMICSLAARAAAGTDFGKRQEELYGRLCREMQKPAELTVSLNPEEKNLISLGITVYELLCREKQNVLKDHFHIETVSLPAEQIREECRMIVEYAGEHELDTSELQKKVRYRKKTPARKLYISDLHFYHDSLNRFMDVRGFAGAEEMNDYMIRQWNDHVTDKDEVYILGDFAISRGREANEILRQLNGRKYLVEGNHDKFLEDKAFDRGLFEWVRSYAEINDAGRKVILSHYPVFCYNGQYRTTPDGKPIAYMLYGHVHNTHDERLVNEFIRITRETKVPSKDEPEGRSIPCHMINCFCMFSDYIPLTLDDWIRVDEARRESCG